MKKIAEEIMDFVSGVLFGRSWMYRYEESNTELTAVVPQAPEEQPKEETPSRRYLTDEEKNFIMENYSEIGAAKCAKMLDRNISTVWRYAYRMGLKKPEHYYTDEELLEMAYRVKLLKGSYPTEKNGWSAHFMAVIEKEGMPSPRTYRAHFGSLQRAWYMAEEHAAKSQEASCGDTTD